MHGTQSSAQTNRASAQSAWGSQVLLAAVLLFGGNLTAADPPQRKEKSDGKESPATFRAYLPTIRLKALLDNERESVADLEKWLQKYEIFLEGGAVNLIERGQLEEGFLRDRLRVLQLEAEYRDSLDQFTRRLHISQERRRQMEEAVTSPLTKVFQGFEALTHDYYEAYVKTTEMERVNNVAQLRPRLMKILTESALVKNATLPQSLSQALGRMEEA
ncbi:MAG TPA: hypothetical protein VMG10_09545 [Gemmataceae bacterium]|nr:hypothetical protein [Gemmataceae bacterium]